MSDSARECTNYLLTYVTMFFHLPRSWQFLIPISLAAAGWSASRLYVRQAARSLSYRSERASITMPGNTGISRTSLAFGSESGRGDT